MKLLYICDTRFRAFNSKEKKYLFKCWSCSLQDLLNNSNQRDIHLWLVCINLIDYIDMLTFSDPFDYENVKKALEKISPHFDLNRENSTHDTEIAVDPLIAFLKNTENKSEMMKCDKVTILSCNIHLWEDRVSELQLLANLFNASMCKFYFFNVHKNGTDVMDKINKISYALEKYSNFLFKNIQLNKIDILQISKEILSLKFVVSFTLSLQNQLVLKCEGTPLITEVGYTAFVSLNKYSVVFDIRAKALKDGISQHLIYGIPIFACDKWGFEQNLVSLECLSRELYENEQVIILRSNINPTDLKMHEKEVRFLWVGTPMLKDETSIALCLHGLSTQETYSLSIEESFKECAEKKDQHISDVKIKEIFNFLILIEQFNPLDYSNERFEYSCKCFRKSLISLPDRVNHSQKRKKKKKTTLLNIQPDDAYVNTKNSVSIGTQGTKGGRKNDILKKNMEILDPRSLLLANMNKAFQKNII
ncbi:hypothetical protein, conserved [Plasmodium gonderi]|uniref:Uncharacterized protein n=1 Tax=Plasmodium gonderi TaxID=77519 RepID=A0A1Y1JKV3_PLAGO|nr:hypothetical protein, conserved [Plasmodium gonderi]GAW82085.1 hypothetical protein, conserved [Plasmodium gonderi]